MNHTGFKSSDLFVSERLIGPLQEDFFSLFATKTWKTSCMVISSILKVNLIIMVEGL